MVFPGPGPRVVSKSKTFVSWTVGLDPGLQTDGLGVGSGS